MSVHNGHRQRVKERFCKEGLDNFNDHQVLELLLFYCIPRRDTNEIAHRLIEKFGSFCRVMDASCSELEKVEGIGHSTAEFLNLVKSVGRYYQISQIKQRKVLATTEAYGEYLTAFLDGIQTEKVYVLSLDAKCKVISCDEIAEGGTNFVDFTRRKVVSAALRAGATTVVLAHNHPSGVALPSQEDVNTTLQIAKSLKDVDVVLYDHLVVADGDYVSFVQSELYRYDMV